MSHHGVVIGDRVVIGARAIVMPGVVVGEGAIVAAGALVTEHTVIGPGEHWAGVPARLLTPAPGGRGDRQGAPEVR